MGLFSKRPTSVIGDIATWPGIENTQQQAVNIETIEQLHNCMPAEWYPQRSIQLTWPHKDTDWKPYLDEVTKCYLRMAYEISTTQTLIIVCQNKDETHQLLTQKLPANCLEHIHLVKCETNDTWSRDHGFITILEDNRYKLLDFRFNGWGNKFEAEKDNAINRQLYQTGLLNGDYYDEQDFVLEGGSIESDGQGTLLTTSECLLNPNRNQGWSKGDIQQYLLSRLQAQRILWLDHGYLAGDDTDSHIDTLARLCPNDTIVYIKCSDSNDEHYDALQMMEQQLQSFETMSGKPYKLVPLPMAPRLYDEDNHRLPATYANYLIMNRKVLMPTYGDKTSDNQAKAVLEKVFPTRSVVGIDCRVLVKQHGSLHCSTMQYY